jgi:hypothetical protein
MPHLSQPLDKSPSGRRWGNPADLAATDIECIWLSQRTTRGPFRRGRHTANSRAIFCEFPETLACPLCITDICQEASSFNPVGNESQKLTFTESAPRRGSPCALRPLPHAATLTLLHSCTANYRLISDAKDLGATCSEPLGSGAVAGLLTVQETADDQKWWDSAGLFGCLSQT